jgi:hypothetical protein
MCVHFINVEIAYVVLKYVNYCYTQPRGQTQNRNQTDLKTQSFSLLAFLLFHSILPSYSAVELVRIANY